MQRVMSGLVTLLLLVSLTGCASKSQARKDVEAYFSAVCEKEGFAKETAENHGCVLVKMQQSTPVRSGGGYAPIPPKTSQTCQQFGNTTRCY